jgi:hypothetical protein
MTFLWLLVGMQQVCKCSALSSDSYEEYNSSAYSGVCRTGPPPPPGSSVLGGVQPKNSPLLLVIKSVRGVQVFS